MNKLVHSMRAGQKRDRHKCKSSITFDADKTRKSLLNGYLEALKQNSNGDTTPAIPNSKLEAAIKRLGKNRSINYLKLRHCGINDAHALALSQALITTPTITALDLRDNGLSKLGALALAQTIRAQISELGAGALQAKKANAPLTQNKKGLCLAYIQFEGNRVPLAILRRIEILEQHADQTNTILEAFQAYCNKADGKGNGKVTTKKTSYKHPVFKNVKELQKSLMLVSQQTLTEQQVKALMCTQGLFVEKKKHVLSKNTTIIRQSVGLDIGVPVSQFVEMCESLRRTAAKTENDKDLNGKTQNHDLIPELDTLFDDNWEFIGVAPIELPVEQKKNNEVEVSSSPNPAAAASDNEDFLQDSADEAQTIDKLNLLVDGCNNIDDNNDNNSNNKRSNESSSNNTPEKGRRPSSRSLGSLEGLDIFLDGRFGTDADGASDGIASQMSGTISPSCQSSQGGYGSIKALGSIGGGDNTYLTSHIDENSIHDNNSLNGTEQTPMNSPGAASAATAHPMKKEGVHSLYDLVVYRPKIPAQRMALQEGGVAVADFGSQELPSLSYLGKVHVTFSSGEHRECGASPRPRSHEVTALETPNSLTVDSNSNTYNDANSLVSLPDMDEQSVAGVLLEHSKSIEVIVGAHNQLGIDGAQLGLPPQAIFTCLHSLDLAHNAIQSLEGLLHPNQFPVLRRLNLSYNCIASLDGLDATPLLEDLRLVGNRIRDVSPVSVLLHLKVCDLSSNCLSTFRAVRALSLNTNLVNLNLAGNRVSEHARYRPYIISLLPFLSTLDAKILPPSRNNKLLQLRRATANAAREQQTQLQQQERKQRVKRPRQRPRSTLEQAAVSAALSTGSSAVFARAFLDLDMTDRCPPPSPDSRDVTNLPAAGSPTYGNVFNQFQNDDYIIPSHSVGQHSVDQNNNNKNNNNTDQNNNSHANTEQNAGGCDIDLHSLQDTDAGAFTPDQFKKNAMIGSPAGHSAYGNIDGDNQVSTPLGFEQTNDQEHFANQQVHEAESGGEDCGDSADTVDWHGQLMDAIDEQGLRNDLQEHELAAIMLRVPSSLLKWRIEQYYLKRGVDIFRRRIKIEREAEVEEKAAREDEEIYRMHVNKIRLSPDDAKKLCERLATARAPSEISVQEETNMDQEPKKTIATQKPVSKSLLTRTKAFHYGTIIGAQQAVVESKKAHSDAIAERSVIRQALSDQRHQSRRRASLATVQAHNAKIQIQARKNGMRSRQKRALTRGGLGGGLDDPRFNHKGLGGSGLTPLVPSLTLSVIGSSIPVGGRQLRTHTVLDIGLKTQELHRLKVMHSLTNKDKYIPAIDVLQKELKEVVPKLDHDELIELRDLVGKGRRHVLDDLLSIQSDPTSPQRAVRVTRSRRETRSLAGSSSVGTHSSARNSVFSSPRSGAQNCRGNLTIRTNQSQSGGTPQSSGTNQGGYLTHNIYDRVPGSPPPPPPPFSQMQLNMTRASPPTPSSPLASFRASSPPPSPPGSPPPPPPPPGISSTRTTPTQGLDGSKPSTGGSSFRTVVDSRLETWAADTREQAHVATAALETLVNVCGSGLYSSAVVAEYKERLVDVGLFDQVDGNECGLPEGATDVHVQLEQRLAMYKKSLHDIIDAMQNDPVGSERVEMLRKHVAEEVLGKSVFVGNNGDAANNVLASSNENEFNNVLVGSKEDEGNGTQTRNMSPHTPVAVGESVYDMEEPIPAELYTENGDGSEDDDNGDLFYSPPPPPIQSQNTEEEESKGECDRVHKETADTSRLASPRRPRADSSFNNSTNDTHMSPVLSPQERQERHDVFKQTATQIQRLLTETPRAHSQDEVMQSPTKKARESFYNNTLLKQPEASVPKCNKNNDDKRESLSNQPSVESKKNKIVRPSIEVKVTDKEKKTMTKTSPTGHRRTKTSPVGSPLGSQRSYATQLSIEDDMAMRAAASRHPSMYNMAEGSNSPMLSPLVSPGHKSPLRNTSPRNKSRNKSHIEVPLQERIAMMLKSGTDVSNCSGSGSGTNGNISSNNSVADMANNNIKGWTGGGSIADDDMMSASGFSGITDMSDMSDFDDDDLLLPGT